MPAGDVEQLIEPLLEAPGESAALFDVDGTLAPIVDDPAEASVPASTREALKALASRLALVACVSGRRAVEARRLVGVDELTYAGNHGLEVLAPGEQRATIEPALESRAQAVRRFALDLDPAALSSVGLRLEDKGPIQALHWRGSPDDGAAEREAREVAERAERTGLEPRWGRKVLELRPTADVDKGTAVRRLLDRRGLSFALFAGDDRTDLDAMRMIRSLVERGELRGAVCIGIASDEAPAALAQEVDTLLRSPEDLVPVIRRLASGGAAERDGADD